MNNFDCTISLGYNCYPCMQDEKKKGIISKNYFFDDIATPAWAIKELLVNDFNGFFDASQYEKIKLFDGSNYEFLTNKQYYMRFTSQYQINKLNSAFDMFRRRKLNFVNSFQSGNKVLFIRYEEPMVSDIPKIAGNRIIYPEYAEKYSKNELDHLAELSTYLQTTYPAFNFNIMFIGNSQSANYELAYNKDSKIFTIPNKNITTGNYDQVFNQIFSEHGAFIYSSLNPTP